MKIVKKLLVLSLILCCIVTTATPANASDIQPISDGTNIADVSLSISHSGQASCIVSVNARSVSQHIEVIMSLNQIGGSTPLKSWSLSGIGSLYAEKNYYVAQGYDYQVIAEITVKDSNGKLIEYFTAKSNIVHY